MNDTQMSENYRISFWFPSLVKKHINMKPNEPKQEVCHIQSQSFDDNCPRHDVIRILQGRFYIIDGIQAFNCETLEIA